VGGRACLRGLEWWNRLSWAAAGVLEGREVVIFGWGLL